jgi:hypothetical protein
MYRCIAFAKRRLLLFSFLVMLWFASFGQLNSYVFPSPNNTFLGYPGSSAGSSNYVGVDQFTGAAEVNIPILNLQSKELNIPISLNYTGGRGIRVQDYASFVGLGWQLNAGGSVSRVVRCYPDEISNGYLGTGQWGQILANNLNAHNGSLVVDNTTLTTSQYYSLVGGSSSSYGPPTADGEPDLFYIRTPFFNVQFTFDERGNPIFSNATGIRVIPINFVNVSNPSATSFEVIDDQGNQFFFGSSSQSTEQTTTKIYGTSYTFPTTWYLDKIVTYNSKDIVSLTYISGANNDVHNHYTGTAAFGYGSSNYDTLTPSVTTIAPAKYVSSIISMLGEVDFNYAWDRQDDANSARLVSLTSKAYNPITQSNNISLQTYNFSYSYFGSPSTDPNILRLELNGITATGNTTGTSTPLTLASFSYNGLNLPSRKLLEVADYWGYNNSNNPNITSLTPFPNNIRTPDLTSAQACILNSVTDINGGAWQIFYELNDFDSTYSTTHKKVSIGGLRVNKIQRSLPTGETLYDTYSYIDNNNYSAGRIFSTGYSTIGFIWAPPVNVVKYVSESASEYSDVNGNFVSYTYVKKTNQNGGYSVSNFTNFDVWPDIPNYLNGQTSSTAPDILSSISFSYKRGLLLDQTTYTSSSNKVSEINSPLTSYSSLTNPAQKKSWGFATSIISYSNLGGNSGSSTFSSIYWTYVENYRLTNMTNINYDQITPSNKIQVNTNYTYDPINNRLLQSVSTSDSKGNNYTKTFYHADDINSVPFLTSGEQSALTAMSNSNCINVLIHETDSRNGVTTQVHNSFAIGNAYNNYNGSTNTYLAGTTSYNGNNVAKQKFFNYDITTSNLISSYATGEKPSAAIYGYNSSYPIAEVTNANNTPNSYQAANTTGSINIPGGQYGTTFTTFNVLCY